MELFTRNIKVMMFIIIKGDATLTYLGCNVVAIKKRMPTFRT
jgi:hypothetical protein